MKFINHSCQHCDYHYVGKTCMNWFIKFNSVTNVKRNESLKKHAWLNMKVSDALMIITRINLLIKYLLKQHIKSQHKVKRYQVRIVNNKQQMLVTLKNIFWQSIRVKCMLANSFRLTSNRLIWCKDNILVDFKQIGLMPGRIWVFASI